MVRIFISYRRADVGGWSRLIRNELKDHLPDADITLDVSAMKPGRDFEQAIDHSLRNVDMVLALIGGDWLAELNSPARKGKKDYMRLELETALTNQTFLIPLLIDGAVMPEADALPESLRKLAVLQAISITHTDFERDIDYVATSIKEAIAELQPRLAGASEPEPKPGVITVRVVDDRTDTSKPLPPLPHVVPQSQIKSSPKTPIPIVDVKLRHQYEGGFPEKQHAQRLRDPRNADGSPRIVPASDNPIEQALIDGLAHLLDATTPATAKLTITNANALWIDIRRAPGIVIIDTVAAWLWDKGDAGLNRVIAKWAGRRIDIEPGAASAAFPDSDILRLAQVARDMFAEVYALPLNALPLMTLNNPPAPIPDALKPIAPSAKLVANPTPPPSKSKTVPPVVPATKIPPEALPTLDLPATPFDADIAKPIREAFTKLLAANTPNATLLEITDRSSGRSIYFTRATPIVSMLVHGEKLSPEQRTKAAAYVTATWRITSGDVVDTRYHQYSAHFPMTADVERFVAIVFAVFENMIGSALKRPPKVRFGSLDFKKYPLR